MRLRLAVTMLAIACGVTGLTGCYRGAVYASYQELGLGIKASAESNSPIKVHFGYDRGAGAWVPRRGGGQQGEEAVALVSRDDVRSTVNPTRLGKDSILQVDSALIAGTAAIVASSPPDSIVTVAPPAAPPVSYAISGNAGDRIAMALADGPRLTPDQLDVQTMLRLLSKRRNQKQVVARATTLLPADFQGRFATRAGQAPLSAFKVTAFEYVEEAPDHDAAVREIQGALKTANDEVP
jgi:hypothetical protein